MRAKRRTRQRGISRRLDKKVAEFEEGEEGKGEGGAGRGWQHGRVGGVGVEEVFRDERERERLEEGGRGNLWRRDRGEVGRGEGSGSGVEGGYREERGMGKRRSMEKREDEGRGGSVEKTDGWTVEVVYRK